MTNKKNEDPKKQNPFKDLDVTIDPQIQGGTYSNFAVVTHTGSEFVVDFMYHHRIHKTARIVSRVILTPDFLELVIKMLQKDYKNYKLETPDKQPDVNKYTFSDGSTGYQ